jgi:hypothetical protein
MQNQTMPNISTPHLRQFNEKSYERLIRSTSILGVVSSLILFSGCASGLLPMAQSANQAMACDEGLKSAFKPDALTSVISVQAFKKGEKVFVSDSGSPATLAADMCMVKLQVGPGNPGPKDARSTSDGIGIEVWLPTHAQWNKRMRNYGGGGYVGGGHLLPQNNGATLATAVGSKFPAPVIAGMGYATATTDAGQRWSQNGSYAFLPDGSLNTTLLQDFSYRSLVEQAIKSKALVKLYYGAEPQFTYFDGHSTGGRQGWKIAQDYPDLYDGYLLAAPAISSSKFSMNSFYSQVVMKSHLGYTSADPGFAQANFKQKFIAINKLAVQSCDKEGLGFLLNPFACNYDPAKDANALCLDVKGDGIVGKNSNAQSCLSLAEAKVINKLWYGISKDGSYDSQQTEGERSGVSLGAKQLWWSFPRGSDWGSIVGNVGSSDSMAIYLQDVSIAASSAVNPSVNFVNASTTLRDKWREIDQAKLVDAFQRGIALQASIGNLNTDRTDLTRLRDLKRKVITYTGLAEDVIPPATSVYHLEQVAYQMGGMAQVQQFLRLYLVPGKAHSSQGRSFTVNGNNNSVPLPKLPGGANQTPTPDQDQMFTALTQWVEKGLAPEDIVIASRDSTVSYPLCVYPKKITWNQTGSAKLASNYSCQ